MSDKDDLYKILGVSESDSDETIKKAYKKLAIKWHPDKNQNNREEAEAKFKEISHAFSILGDKQKREEYDSMKKGGFSGGSGGYRFSNFSDSHDFTFYDKMFKNFFKSDFGDFSSAFDDDDDFFKSAFSGGNFSGGSATSTKTVTTIINGKKVTKTEKTYTDKDGKRVTEVTETTGDGKTKTTKMLAGEGGSSSTTSYTSSNNMNSLDHRKSALNSNFGAFGGFSGFGSGFGGFDDFDNDDFFQDFHGSKHSGNGQKRNTVIGGKKK